MGLWLLFGYIVYTSRAFDNTRIAYGRHEISTLSTARLVSEYEICSKLRSVPKDPSGPREKNARYVDGQKPILIRNATIWTGEASAGISPEDAFSGKGYSWIQADVLLEKGLISKISPDIATVSQDYTIWDAKGRLLTAGIVDMHSHTGVFPLPNLVGSSDDNELSSDITPYVRSIDGLNPLDPQLEVIKSGGVTTSLVLPGSGNNMGGEAYVIKHAVGKANGRTEISAEDMLADPEKNWRYMKMACGENAKRVYGKMGRNFGPFSRLGEAWYFRHALEQASNLVKAQDDWCDTADRIGPESMSSYLPQDLQWESLGAVLRGQVHVNTHCYTIPDLEAFVRHTNEFKFPVRAFHHAHQTYLVPEILKRVWGGQPPAAALFSDNMYYKVEAYTASEQAGKILYENGITPVYVSDNPVLNAQHVVFEAAKAYRNGLPYDVAIAGVTSAPAKLLGLGERIGKVKVGFDADIVVWDSDPLEVGATPVQVWIDGAPQFKDAIELKKPPPKPLRPQLDLQDEKEIISTEDIILAGITKIFMSKRGLTANGNAKHNMVVIRNGSIECVGSCVHEVESARLDGVKTIYLRDGHIAPPMTAFGSLLGIEEIAGEEDTKDGANGKSAFSSAADGLLLGGKSLQAAFAHGVTRAISAPASNGGGLKGVSAGFYTRAKHAGENGPIFEEDVALHYTLTLAAKQGKTPSISSALAELREKLFRACNFTVSESLSLEDKSLRAVVNGKKPLVLTVHSADTIAHVLRLKSQIEAAMSEMGGAALRMVIHGGAESYLLAHELAAANVGVVLAPFQPYAFSWDQRRSLTGAPLTNGTAIDILRDAGVKVAIGTSEDWETRDLALYAGIARINSGGKISEDDAIMMVSSNIYEMLGLQEKTGSDCFTVYDGNPLEINSRIRAVADGRGGVNVWV